MFTKLLGLNYKIVYKRGIDKSAADALSRMPHDDHLVSVSTITPQWLEDVSTGYASDPVALDMLSKLAVSGVTDPHFSLHSGFLRYNGKIWLGSNSTLHSRVFAALHSSAVGGHSGAPATYHRIRQLFYWPSMKSDIYRWV